MHSRQRWGAREQEGVTVGASDPKHRRSSNLQLSTATECARRALRICEEHRIAQYHGQALCADGWAIGVSGESEKGLAQIGQGVDGHGLGGILAWPAISPPSSPTISLQPAA